MGTQRSRQDVQPSKIQDTASSIKDTNGNTRHHYQGLSQASFTQADDSNIFSSGNFSARYVTQRDPHTSGKRKASNGVQIDVRESTPLTVTGGFKALESASSDKSTTDKTVIDKSVDHGFKAESAESKQSLLSSSLKSSTREPKDLSPASLKPLSDPKLANIIEKHLVRSTGPQPQGTSQGNKSNAPESFNSLKLKSGDMTREIYNWVNNQKKTQAPLRRVLSSGSVSTTTSSPFSGTQNDGESSEHMSVRDILAPGGFRRSFMQERQSQPAERQDFLTRNFFEFLAMYGQFAGEDLSDYDDDEEVDDSSDRIDSSSELGSTDDEASSSDETVTDSEAIEENSIAGSTHELLSNVALASSPSANYKATINTMRTGRSSISSSMKPLEPPQVSGAAPTTAAIKSRHHHRHHTHGHNRYHAKSHIKAEKSSRKKTSTIKSFFLLLKAFIGTGIIFLPKSYSNGGLAFCLIMILVFSVVSYYCFITLIGVTSCIHVSGYGDVGMKLYGPICQFLILISLVLSQIGFASSYTVFVADNLQYLSNIILGSSHSIGFYIILMMLFFIPISFTRKIGKLGLAAFLADLFIFIGIVYIYYESSANIRLKGIASVSMFKSQTWPLFMGTAVFAYEGIGLLIPIREAMAEPEYFNKLLFLVIVITTFMFTTLPSLAYLSYGEKVKTVVLMNFRINASSLTVQLLYTLAILLSAPIQLFPAIKIVEKWLFHRNVKHWHKKIRRDSQALLASADLNSPGYDSLLSPEVQFAHSISHHLPQATSPVVTTEQIQGLVNDEELISGKAYTKVKWLKNLLRLSMVVLMCLIAYFGSENLDRFVSLVGSFTCIPLIYIYPPLLYNKCAPDQITWKKRIINDVITICGISMMCYTSWQTISTW